MAAIVQRYLATRGFISQAIKYVEGVSSIDHVECLNRKGDGWIGAHARIGVQDLPLNWADASGIVWERRYSLGVTDAQYELIMGFLEANIGAKYDYADILGILFHDRQIEDAKRIMCSALQYEAMWTGGVQMLNVLAQFAHLVTPETLHLSPLLIGRCVYSFPPVPQPTKAAS